jgi:hypothetical protein
MNARPITPQGGEPTRLLKAAHRIIKELMAAQHAALQSDYYLLKAGEASNLRQSISQNKLKGLLRVRDAAFGRLCSAHSKASRFLDGNYP